MTARLLSVICCLSACALVFSGAHSATAQHVPAMGFMYPSGGQAGQTVNVVLGGYDWTPDMQVFVHDPRIKLEITGPPGPVIVPEPPYWFGKKARRGPFQMPRETPARLTIPADMPPGIVAWQAANVNGATAKGYFVVGNFPEVVEVDGNAEPQAIASLPVTINGQIKVTEDVDRYSFRAEKAGLITCLVTGRKLGLDLNAVVEVRNEQGLPVADAADTAGNELAFSFAVEANRTYTVSIFDADFRGDRAFVYRLTLAANPRVMVAVPAVGKRGEIRPVQFVGYGLQTGAAKLETITKDVAFPAAADKAEFAYELETPQGKAFPFTLHLSNLSETVDANATAAPQPLTLPASITGVLQQQSQEKRYTLTGVKGDAWSIDLAAAKLGSSLDVALAILNAEGKELVRNDDANGSTDAALEFTVPADGAYTLVVSDVSGNSGSPLGTYRLTVNKPQPGFSLSIPDLLPAPLGTVGKLALKGTRSGGFDGPIKLTLTGLPAGVTLPAEMLVPEKKPAAPLDLTVAADAATTAALVTLTAEAQVGEQLVKQEVGKFLFAITMIPPFSLDAEGKDDVTKWPRGTTFPAPVLIERKPGFNGEIMLEMTSRQGRVCQGIWAPEMAVPPSVSRVLYPIFLPEWLETTRTSRMVCNGVAKIPDPKGNIRYSTSQMITRIGFLPEGALLKLTADVAEVSHTSGQPLEVPLTISRSAKLKESVQLELRPLAKDADAFSAAPVTLAPEQTAAVFPITLRDGVVLAGERTVTIRATVLQEGTLPVVSEANVVLRFGAASAGR